MRDASQRTIVVGGFLLAIVVVVFFIDRVIGTRVLSVILAGAGVVAIWSRRIPYGIEGERPMGYMQGKWAVSQAKYAASGNITERTAEYLFYPEVFRTKETYALSRRSDSAPSVSSNLFSPVLYVNGMIAAVVLAVAAWWLPLAKRN
jgi:hypothetical protein